jgi:hypothetical protein
MTIALVETPAPNPMSKQDDHRKNAEVKMVPRGAIAADRSHLFALAEHRLRPADQLDYMIRRWMIRVPFEANRLIATDPFFRWSSLVPHDDNPHQQPGASMDKKRPWHRF